MNAISRLAIAGACALGVIAALTAASTPSVLARAEGGLWEISRTGGGETMKMCVANPVVLAQFEHRKASCARDVIRDAASSAVISYNCSGGDFGRSEVTVLTPRSLRVETQGISANAPFKYTFQARRVGNC